MAKPKAPRWLTEAFRDGVDERDAGENEFGIERARGHQAYPGAHPNCWLAQFDSVRQPCSGDPAHFLERMHLIPRQRVEAVMWDALLWSAIYEVRLGRVTEGVFRELSKPERDELVLLAAWDSRNGKIGCQGHHRRFDLHAGSPSAPSIIVPEHATPGHLREFVADYGLWTPFEQRFPVALDNCPV